MAGIVLASGNVSVEMSDGIVDYVDRLLNEAAPSLRPAMERLIKEAAQEVRDHWPNETARERFEIDKRRAVQRAQQTRYQRKKQGLRTKEISFWDFMPYQYPPPGYRSSGKSRDGWRVEVRLLAGPVLEAVMLNDERKNGAPYPYMAKKPPPHSNQTYLKTIAIPAISKREQQLVDRLSEDLSNAASEL